MEEKNFKRTTVTAALPYANGGVHIGHLAGVYVPADIYVRYLRLKKKEVTYATDLLYMEERSVQQEQSLIVISAVFVIYVKKCCSRIVLQEFNIL